MLIPLSARSVLSVAFRSSDIGDPSATRTVYAIVIVLVVIGLAFLCVAIWLFRQTRVDAELLAPLERMDTRRWRKADPAKQRRLLDEARPEGAEPLHRADLVPAVDEEFADEHRPVPSFDDFVGVAVAPERPAEGDDEDDGGQGDGAEEPTSALAGASADDEDGEGQDDALEESTGAVDVGSGAVSEESTSGEAADEESTGAVDVGSGAVFEESTTTELPPPDPPSPVDLDAAEPAQEEERNVVAAAPLDGRADTDDPEVGSSGESSDEAATADATPRGRPQPLLPGEELLTRPGNDED